MNLVYVVTTAGRAQPMGAVAIAVENSQLLGPVGWRFVADRGESRILTHFTFWLGRKIEGWRHTNQALNESVVRRMVEDAAEEAGVEVVASFQMTSAALSAISLAAFQTRLESAVRDGFAASDGAHLG